MKTTSSPSSRTPLNATVKEYQSSPPRRSSRAAAACTRSDWNVSSSSCNSLYPLERRIALRSHCRPNASNSAPTTRRSVPIGIEPSAGPSAATRIPRTIPAAPAPISVERHPRTTPTPSTIVNASTISTALARNAPATTRIVPVLMAAATRRARGRGQVNRSQVQPPRSASGARPWDGGFAAARPQAASSPSAPCPKAVLAAVEGDRQLADGDLVEVGLDELDGRAFADGGGAAFGRPGADVSGREHARDVGLEQVVHVRCRAGR